MSLHVLHIPLTVNVKLISVTIPAFNRVEHYLVWMKSREQTKQATKGFCICVHFHDGFENLLILKVVGVFFVSHVPLHHCKKREEDAGRTGALDGFLLLFLIQYDIYVCFLYYFRFVNISLSPLPPRCLCLSRVKRNVVVTFKSRDFSSSLTLSTPLTVPSANVFFCNTLWFSSPKFQSCL